jgi:hypothetical protein
MELFDSLDNMVLDTLELLCVLYVFMVCMRVCMHVSVCVCYRIL